MKLKIMQEFNKLLSLIDEHSVFALERVKTDNFFFENYKRMIEDNGNPNDIYAIINKHRRELDQFIKYINPEYIEEKLVELSPFAYSMYKIESTKFVNDLFMAMTMAELILRYTYPEADPRCCEIATDSSLFVYYKLDLIGFKYIMENIGKVKNLKLNNEEEEGMGIDSKRNALEMYYAIKRMKA